jgi:hypothetical protein
MRLLPLLLVPGLAAAAPTFDAVPRQPGKLGLGIGGGTGPSGISAKYTLDDAFSLQGVVGPWSEYFEDGDTLGISIDALVEMPALHEEEDFELGWALGAGPALGVGDRFWAGIAGVVGLEFNIRVIPLEVTLEWRPHLLLASPFGTEFDPVEFGGHIRWWF